MADSRCRWCTTRGRTCGLVRSGGVWRWSSRLARVVGWKRQSLSLTSPGRYERNGLARCRVWRGAVSAQTQGPCKAALIGAPHETRRKWRGHESGERHWTEAGRAVRRAFLITTRSLVAPAASTQTPARRRQPCSRLRTGASPASPLRLLRYSSSLSFAPSTAALQRAFPTLLRACRSVSSFTQANCPPAPTLFVFTARPQSEHAPSTAGRRHVYSSSLSSEAPLPSLKLLKH